MGVAELYNILMSYMSTYVCTSKQEIWICLYVLTYYYISDTFMSTMFTLSAALCLKINAKPVVAVIVNSCELTDQFIAKS